MTDGISRIGQGNTSGVGGGFYSQAKDNTPEDPTPKEPVLNNYEETQVDPAKVMDFLAKNNYFVNMVKTSTNVEPIVNDPALLERIGGYVESYEYIMSIIENEFGAELAPMVMDMVMDRLMGMAA